MDRSDSGYNHQTSPLRDFLGPEMSLAKHNRQLFLPLEEDTSLRPRIIAVVER